MSVILVYVLVALVIFLFFKLIHIVPESETYLVEQFGKYKRTLGSGLHLIIPVVQRIAYKIEMREQVIDVEPQLCITSDNVQVLVDGILYLKVVDPIQASYGIDDYRYATAQLAQTTMRSEIGKLDLDRTFSEREEVNDAIVKAIDEASDPWGVKVTRYEVKNITPTEGVQKAMEQQMRAEREKRAEILASEGERESRINVSRGDRQYAINVSEGERQRRINESEGRAKATEITAEATAEGVRLVAAAIEEPGGGNAVSLRLAEQYVRRFGKILEEADVSLVPAELANLRGALEAVGPALGIGGEPRSSTRNKPTGGGVAAEGTGGRRGEIGRAHV